jgi:hypothetical protein
MDYTKIIHDFIDGGLDATQEQDLFYNLSSSDELRSELKQQIAIKEAIKSDSRAFTPAASSTVGLFASLGFNPPASTMKPAPVPGSGLMNFLTKYRQGLIGGAIAAIVTGSVLFFISNPFGKQESLTQPVKMASVQPQSSSSIPGNVPRVVSKSNDEEQVKVRYITKIRYVNVPRYVDKMNAQATESQLSESNTDTFVNLTKSEQDNFIKPVLTSNIQENIFPNISLAPVTNRLSSLIIPGNPLGLSLEFRGSQNWNIPAEIIYPQKLSKFNNLALSAYYNITDNFSAGLEIRQETFFQQYEGTKDGGRYEYQQQPNFTSYGLNLRYTLPFDFLGFEPFGQISGGLTNAGYIGRGMVGLKYSPYRDISFILGGEGSRLFYQHQGTGYNTDKFGLNYGVLFNF